MIRSQIVVLNVIYDDGTSDERLGKSPPVYWDWSSLIDEPINNAVEVLAAGPLKDYPRPGQEEV